MIRVPLAASLSCCLFLGGCLVGRQDLNEPLDATLVSRLQPGTTTAQQVTGLFGAPAEVVQLGRRTAYRYVATTTKSAGLWLVVVILAAQDTRSDWLWVFFDENNVLTHYGSTFAVHRTQYALPWEDVHEAEDNAARDAERPGVGAK